MDRFAIITNRKRAIIALVHSVFFLGVAGMQLAISHAEAFSIHREKMTGSMILLVIYVIVTTVLLALLLASHCAKEKLYFALCAAGAAFGLAHPAWRSGVTRQRFARTLSGGRRPNRDRHPAHTLRNPCERQSRGAMTHPLAALRRNDCKISSTSLLPFCAAISAAVCPSSLLIAGSAPAFNSACALSTLLCIAASCNAV